MSGLWGQDVLAGGAALAALAWLVRRALARRGACGCDGCPAARRGAAASCAGGAGAAPASRRATALITIASPPAR